MRRDDMIQRKDGGNLYGLTQNEFYLNLLLISLLFCGSSFNFWLINFQLEYLGTNIFVLFLANGAVCIIAS